ncbi:energy transducer TonB, partial [Rhodovulum sp. NI22]
APAPAKPAPAPVAPPPDVSAAVNDALAEALGGGAAETTGNGAAAVGPPMTQGEKDALRIAVGACWNVGSLSSEAMRTTVVVALSMAEDAKPKIDTISMKSFSGGSEAAARQTYESARRAIIRCGATGFDLPKEKYGQWRNIEMTFNPENMRIK